MMRRAAIVGLTVLLGVGLRAQAVATETEAQPYSGGVFTRSTLTGDWLGTRNALAEKGITFDTSVTQITQGIVRGGKDSSWEYGGRGNLTGNLDTQKLGLWPGGFLNVELEGNWTNSVNGSTGALVPANANQLFPVPISNNVALPQVMFAQFLSHYVGVVAGKLDGMAAADANEFAHGKGDTQFFNLAYGLNPVTLVVPYSTLGTGVIVLPTADPDQAIVSLLVDSATGKATTDGFDNLNGAIFAGEGRVRTDFFGFTGHQLVGALYSNKQYTSIDQRIEVLPERPGRPRPPVRSVLGSGGSPAIEKKTDTWAMWYNFDHFLYETDKSAGKGIGVFGRFGASAGNPNPMQYFYSVGVGGKGMIPSRDHDRFGVGFYYTTVESPTLQHPIVGTASPFGDEWGVEAFYNVALTPWMLLSPDVQVIGPSQKRKIVNGSTVGTDTIGTATALGFRLQLLF